MRVLVYGLAASTEDEVMYVGKATDKERRLSQHILAARRGEKSEKSQWIRGLLSQGISPVAITLEECDKSEWSERERIWILHYRKTNHLLTNVNDAKTERLPIMFSEEDRNKLKILARDNTTTGSESEVLRMLLRKAWDNPGRLGLVICETENEVE